MKNTIFLFIFLTISFYLFSDQTELSPDNKIINYLEFFQTIETFQADFFQEKKIAIFDAIQNSKGYIKFKKSGTKLIWALTEPYISRLILNDQTIISEIPALDEKNIFKLEENPGYQIIFNNIFILMGLSPLEKIEKTYKISIKKNNITLMPKNKDFQAFIQKIVIELNADNLAKKIQLIENEENYTIIRFNNYKLNELIDDKNFN